MLLGVLDPWRFRHDVALYDELRASFDDPLPIHSEVPLHPFMVAGHVEANKAKQLEWLGRIEREHSDVKERGLKLAQEFEVAQKDQPKPGQPGQNPPGTRPTPGQPIHTPPNVPGSPGYDPNKPVTPPEPQPTHHEDNP